MSLLGCAKCRVGWNFCEWLFAGYECGFGTAQRGLGPISDAFRRNFGAQVALSLDCKDQHPLHWHVQAVGEGPLPKLLFMEEKARTDEVFVGGLIGVCGEAAERCDEGQSV